ncbi:VanZ family protein [Anoxybacteroides rupiense]|uniref:VanZ family protein n=1 Tax=Anoxybacteroides rupiense TaxID=311460 RepID=A0ABD5IVC7_9BACL|nr:VanZ family protein [Anoxybacillus rupiensis]MBB3905763.1 glycopeptide antibiotics resistance protein [Anoxybacillus rupiensis]MED5052274.1 VanZ family protein [Anoxybacillus rupiensis]
MKKFFYQMFVWLFCLYLFILTKMVLFKYVSWKEMIYHFDFSAIQNQWHSSNFTPLKTIIFYLFFADVNLNIKIENLAGNIIGFIPFGWMLPLLSTRFRSFSATMLATLCLSFTYEVMQLLFELGSFDIDDLILNTLGGILGYSLSRLIQPIWHPKNMWLKQATAHRKEEKV